MYVIYKDLFGLKVTTEENYNARIRDERKVANLYEFDSPEQAIEYLTAYSDATKEDFRVEV